MWPRPVGGCTGGSTAIRIVAIIVVAPAALHLSVRLCVTFGLPTRISGLWPTVIAVLVAFTISTALASVLWSPAGRAQALGAARVLAEYALVIGGLLLAAWMLDGVRVEAGPGWRQLLLLAVLATLFTNLSLELSAPGVTVILMLTISALKLWLLS